MLTRRERHERIISSFSHEQIKWAWRELLARCEHTDLLTDEAVEMLARRAVASWKFHEKLAREHRAAHNNAEAS